MKYIVYITTNSVNKKIYVGIHKTETPYDFDGYLGCGVRVNDKHTYRFSKTPFEAAVNKYGPDKFIRKTLCVFDTLEEALQEEINIVNEDFIKRRDTYNIALGGGIPPIITKTIYQYSLRGEFIKEWDSITEASLNYKCSNSAIGKAVLDKTPSLGFLWTEIKYDFCDLETFKINENKLTTYLYDIQGNFLQEFESISDCAKHLDITLQQVSTAIRGKYSLLKKFYVSNIQFEKFPMTNSKSYKESKLYQYDLDGTFIKEWESYSEICKFFGKTLNIHSSIRLGGSCEDFQWSWEYKDSLKNLKRRTEKRKVGKYTINNELVCIFNSVREAKNDTCGAPNVLSGNRKTAGGHIFKYIDD